MNLKSDSLRYYLAVILVGGLAYLLVMAFTDGDLGHPAVIALACAGGALLVFDIGRAIYRGVKGWKEYKG